MSESKFFEEYPTAGYKGELLAQREAKEDRDRNHEHCLIPWRKEKEKRLAAEAELQDARIGSSFNEKRWREEREKRVAAEAELKRYHALVDAVDKYNPKHAQWCKEDAWRQGRAGECVCGYRQLSLARAALEPNKPSDEGSGDD